MEQLNVQERISETHFNDVISSDSVKDISRITDMMRNLADEFGVHQFMTNFVGVEVTKSQHNIRVPFAYINTVSVASSLTEFSTYPVENTGSININDYTRFDTDRKLLVTVNDIIGKNGSISGYMGPMHSKKNIKEFFRYQKINAPDPVSAWSDVSNIDYKDFYAACRVVAFYSGWIGATGNVELCITDEPIVNVTYSATEIDIITSCVKSARSALIAKAMNFWLTNHNTGQGKMTYFLGRALKLSGVLKSDADLNSDTAADITTDIYNAVHFADVRNILYSILGNSIENGYTFTAMIASGFFAPRKHAIDGFVSPRLTSAPSGVARVFIAHAGLREIVAKPACLVFPEKSSFNDLIHYMRDITSYPALYHMGYSYLCSDRDGSVIGIEFKKYIDNSMLERVLRAVAGYVFAIIPQSTLAKSPHMTKYRDLVKADPFYAQCLELAEVKTFTSEDLKKLATISITGSLNLSMNAFLTATDPNDKLRLRNDIISELGKVDKDIRSSSKPSAKFEFSGNKMVPISFTVPTTLPSQAPLRERLTIGRSSTGTVHSPESEIRLSSNIPITIAPGTSTDTVSSNASVTETAQVNANVNTTNTVTDTQTGTLTDTVPITETAEEINKINFSNTDSSQ